MVLVCVSREYKDSANCRMECKYAKALEAAGKLKIVYLMMQAGCPAPLCEKRSDACNNERNKHNLAMATRSPHTDERRFGQAGICSCHPSRRERESMVCGWEWMRTPDAEVPCRRTSRRQATLRSAAGCVCTWRMPSGTPAGTTVASLSHRVVHPPSSVILRRWLAGCACWALGGLPSLGLSTAVLPTRNASSEFGGACLGHSLCMEAFMHACWRHTLRGFADLQFAAFTTKM